MDLLDAVQVEKDQKVQTWCSNIHSFSLVKASNIAPYVYVNWTCTANIDLYILTLTEPL